ncbi:alpha/beta-hydrolase [Hortaea werneckii]|nr:alpha/beta-hydrolase [Hortaea werneckii]
MKFKAGFDVFASSAIFVTMANGALYDYPVFTDSGPVLGSQALTNETISSFKNWQDITVWKGIPFAATTAGQNRWRPPQPAAKWNETLNATSYGPGCPQASTSLFGGMRLKRRASTTSSSTSEDCLSVNIWSPATHSSEKLPVAVWSYGAGGTSSDDDIVGAGMADQGIVFVTYNYRVGPFGWLALPELMEESPHNITGNYGLWDQIEVLKWVKNNIAAFGGDPDCITTAGQSFGSGAVLHTVQSPEAKGLIKGAIGESGFKSPYDPELSGYGSQYVTYEDLIPYSETYMSSLNASTVATLRGMTTDQLLDGTGAGGFSSSFYPVLDGYLIPKTYYESLTEGVPNDVPILVGNNKDEDGIDLSTTYNVSSYYSALESRYNETFATTFEELFPANNTAEATSAYNDQVRAEYEASTWQWSELWSRKQQSPVYTYLWSHAPMGSSSGATHGSEIPFVLNSLYGDDGSSWTVDDIAVAKQMSSYWANFIKTGNPNRGESYKRYSNGSLAYWPSNREENVSVFNLGDNNYNMEIAERDVFSTILTWFENATSTPY